MEKFIPYERLSKKEKRKMGLSVHITVTSISILHLPANTVHLK